MAPEGEIFSSLNCKTQQQLHKGFLLGGKGLNFNDQWFILTLIGSVGGSDAEWSGCRT